LTKIKNVAFAFGNATRDDLVQKSRALATKLTLHTAYEIEK